MLTIVMQGEEALFHGEAELPPQYFNPIFDRDRTCEFRIYRVFTGDPNNWSFIDRSTGISWNRVAEAEVPSAARLAALLCR